MTAAKLIVIRFIIALVGAVLYTISPQMALFGILCLSLSTFIDWIDGIFAEKQKQGKPFGGFMDISTDQLVEYLFWGVFLHLHLVPIWIPAFIVIRNTFINLLRMSAIKNGFAMFGSKSLVKSGIGKILVGARASRGAMVLAKAIGFISITIAYYSSGQQGAPSEFSQMMHNVGVYSLMFLALIHVVRGSIITFESKELLKEFLWSKTQAVAAYQSET
ncbi:MAG: CDP-alcohol phosphatidyltransferase family protein [Fibrobacter sp.]|nr:CDP-alcohol phosphatidyltransferase family protein [Fibrobacter sp.]